MLYRLRTQILNPYKVYQKIGNSNFDADKFKRLLDNHSVFRQSHKPIASFMTAISDRFFFNPREDLNQKLIQKMPSRDQHRIESDAEKVMQRIVDLLGSGPVFLDNEINWARDFKSGRDWPMLPHTKVVINYNDHSDIKVAWELSRAYHFVTLGKAFRLTNNPDYYKEFKHQVLSWISANPVGFGPNWACSMDVAIRAVNWICSIYLFADDSKMEDEDFWSIIFASLLNHGLFICNNLEVKRDCRGRVNNNNHFMANLCGLIFLGIFFKDLDQGEKWLGLAVKDFNREVLRQTNKDGCDFEASTAYHRLVIEMVTVIVILLLINGHEVSRPILERLFAALRFINSYTRPDGKAPQIGDNDDGRFLALGFLSNDQNDHRYLLDLGQKLFDIPFENANQKISHYAHWFGSCFPLKKNMSTNLRSIGKTQKTISDEFPESGYFISKCQNDFTVITSGKVGTRGTGNHTHNNVFSFEIIKKRIPMIVDPGTYMYTGDAKMRNLFRSTFYHNVIQVDNAEINSMPPDSVFGMTEEAHPKVIEWVKNDDGFTFKGVHHGYRSLNLGIRHYRNICYCSKKSFWVIHDKIESKKQKINKNHTVRQIFHLHPDASDIAETKFLDEKQMMKLRCGISNIGYPHDLDFTSLSCIGISYPKYNFWIINIDTKPTKTKILSGWVSPHYGIKVPAKIVVFEKQSELPTEILTVIF